jgi:hypothetical protein
MSADGGGFPLDDLPWVSAVLDDAPEFSALAKLALSASPSRRRALRHFFDGANSVLGDIGADADASAATKAATFGDLRTWAAVLNAWPSRSTLVLRPTDQGLFTALLCVLDAVHMAPENAELRVDWTLCGTETDFTYGQPGECVWQGLFEPLIVRPRAAATHAAPRDRTRPCGCTTSITAARRPRANCTSRHISRQACRLRAAAPAGSDRPRTQPAAVPEASPAGPPLVLRESRFNHALRTEHFFSFRKSRFYSDHHAAYHAIYKGIPIRDGYSYTAVSDP